MRIVYSNAALLRYLGALRVETTRGDLLPGADATDLTVRKSPIAYTATATGDTGGSV